MGKGFSEGTFKSSTVFFYNLAFILALSLVKVQYGLRWDFWSFYADVFNLRFLDSNPGLRLPPSIQSPFPLCIAIQITD